MEIGLSPNFDITGTKWYHKTGKDSFTVREVIMDPSQGMIVLAEDGRTFSMDAMDNYIQTNEPFNAPQYSTPPVDLRGLDKETPIYAINPTDTTSSISLNDSIEEYPLQPTEEHHSERESYIIVDRALSNLPLPKISFSISLDDQLISVIKLLRDIMKIDIEDIVKYYSLKLTECDNPLEAEIRDTLSHIDS